MLARRAPRSVRSLVQPGLPLTMATPPPGLDWVLFSNEPLPVGDALTWAVLPSCGAVVTFSGTVRDHSEGRPDVSTVEYEAYAEYVEPRLAEVAAAARRRWPVIGRVALFHRAGLLGVGEVSVVVAVSAPHRIEAFEAARFCIDDVKGNVPIWKHETWSGGSEWVHCDHSPVPAEHADEPVARTGS